MKDKVEKFITSRLYIDEKEKSVDFGATYPFNGNGFACGWCQTISYGKRFGKESSRRVGLTNEWCSN